MAAWAADLSQVWQVLSFDQLGLHATLWVKVIQALYYKAGKDRLLTIVLVRDPEGKRPHQMFYCTRLDWRLVKCSVPMPVAGFENSKQFLGLEEPANRLPLAVQRTAPMALVLYSLIAVWFHRVGHAWVRFRTGPGTRGRPSPRSPTC
jgi:hypothetical protein